MDASDLGGKAEGCEKADLAVPIKQLIHRHASHPTTAEDLSSVQRLFQWTIKTGAVLSV